MSIAHGVEVAARTRCRECGAFVTTDFARVFGNNQDEVYGCLECMTATEIEDGGARDDAERSERVVAHR